MATPNKPYIAGTATIPTATTDYAYLSQVFAADIIAAGVDNWYNLLVGVQSTFIFTFNKQIGVKFKYRNSQNVLTTGDEMIWRNPVPASLTAKYRETQERDNHTLKIEEVLISNSSGSDVIVDVQIFANNNGPFIN